MFPQVNNHGLQEWVRAGGGGQSNETSLPSPTCFSFQKEGLMEKHRVFLAEHKSALRSACITSYTCVSGSRGSSEMDLQKNTWTIPWSSQETGKTQGKVQLNLINFSKPFQWKTKPVLFLRKLSLKENPVWWYLTISKLQTGLNSFCTNIVLI